VPVDIDGVAVQAVAGEIRDVMLAVQMLHPSHDRVERAIHHQGGYVPLRHAELLMRGFRMTEIQWHWCFSLGEYRDGKRSLDRRGTKSGRRTRF
jgi:hypothetical protein